MSKRGVLLLALVAVLVGMLALPAMAHHTEQHHASSCMSNTPAYGSGDAEVSGWSVHATNGPIGVRSNDVYLFADASADNGVVVYVFQPYWDNQSPPVYPGPHWVDLGVGIGPNGPVLCNQSHFNG